jgi:ribonucleoside-diphosphate reductase alpha chain
MRKAKKNTKQALPILPDINNQGVSYKEALKLCLNYFDNDELCAETFIGKYSLTTPEGAILEPTPTEMHHRLAKEFARIEKKYPNPLSEQEIFDLLDKFRYVCVTSDTWITTGKGCSQVKDLIEKPFDAVVDGKLYRSTRAGFFHTGKKPVYLLKTKSGMELKATEDHPILTHVHLGWWLKHRKAEWRNLCELKPGDKIVVQNHRGNWWSGDGTFGEGWLVGYFIGDGTCANKRGDSGNLQTHTKTEFDINLKLINKICYNDKQYRSQYYRNSIKGCYNKKTEKGNISSKPLAKLMNKFGVEHGNKKITDLIEKASSDFYCGFFSGLADVDGSVNISKGKDIRYNQSDFNLLKRLQRMLLRIGINSSIYERHKAGKHLFPGRSKKSNCKANYDLIISKDNIDIWNDRVKFQIDKKQNKLNDNMVRPRRRDRFYSEIKSIEYLGQEDVYDCTIPGISAFDANGFYVHNCPQGSPMSGIGNKFQIQSLGNCFVLPPPLDSYGSILLADQQIVQLSKRRAGVGLSLSNIRPKGMPTNNAAKSTDGIGVFMERFSNSIREVGQCLEKDTRILTFEGIKAISTIKIGDLVWTNEGWIPVEAILKNKKKLIKISTKHGKEIFCSEDHVFHTINGNRALKELKVLDPITQIVGNGWAGKDIKLKPSIYSSPKRLSTEEKKELETLYRAREYSCKQLAEKFNIDKSTIWQTIKKSKSKCKIQTADIQIPDLLDNKLSYILGLMYGDGYVDRRKKTYGNITIALSMDYPEIIKKLNIYFKDIFNYNINFSQKKGEKCVVAKVGSKKIVDFLQINEILKQKADRIVFPNIFFQAKQEYVFSFISGFFDADGTVSFKKKGYKMSSICKEFLLDIQIVLASHGVVSNLHREIRDMINWKDLYSLTINGERSQNIFFKLMKESAKINRHARPFQKKRDFTRSIFKIKDFGSRAGRHSYILDDNQYISYSTANRINVDLKTKFKVNLLQDQIKNIEYLGNKEHEVYDLVLPIEHLFFANGLYAHNSGRRGALLESISCHHPEVETFINIKKDKKKVTGANVSVEISDEFMEAVKKDTTYEQRWPIDAKNPKLTKQVKAKEIWNQIIDGAWNSAEPGVLFIDTVRNNSPADCYAKKDERFFTTTTNPCGEIAMGTDSCRLMLLNLVSYVENPFTKKVKFNWDLFSKHAGMGQRLMDDMVDLELECMERILKKIESDPEPDDVKKIEKDMWQTFKETCRLGRRTGLGLTAVGDTIAAMGMKYDSKKSIEFVEKIYQTLCLESYRSSIFMAKERGAFPLFEYSLEKNHQFINKVMGLDSKLKTLWKKYGRRNVVNLTTAPAGSVSILTQTTSGIEPVFKIAYKRRKKINPSDKNARVDFVDELGDKWQEYQVYHHGFKKWMEVNKKTEKDIEESPYWKATANEIDWNAGVEIQAAAQKWIDHSISKTANLPEDISKEAVGELYMKAWKLGLKGFTVYREGSRSGVLISNDDSKEAPVAIDSKNRDKAKFVEHHAPKRPESLPCGIHRMTVKGEGWNIFIGLLDERPYELFAGRSNLVDIPKTRKTGFIKKNGVYNLHIGEGENEIIIKDLSAVFDNPTEAAFTRTVSLALRHGVPIQYVVEQIEKGASKDNDMFSLAKALARVLKSFIGNDTRPSLKVCPECKGTDLKYQEGCISCSCGYSKCN